MKPTQKRVAFVAFSDLHIEDWKQHSINHSRLYHNRLIIDIITTVCRKHNCPALFCGDLYDDPKQLSNLVLRESLNWLRQFNKDQHLYAICGNHDQSEKNTSTHTSPNYVSTIASILPNAITSINNHSIRHGKFTISGIPYLTANDGMEEAIKKTLKKVAKEEGKKILLIHSDLPGAIDPSGREIGSSNLSLQLSKLFKGFDLVLAGHIHKPQVLRKLNPTIIMLGATHQQRVTDSGTKMGYWLIYEDLTYKFIPLDVIPKFIYLKSDETKLEDGNFYIQEKERVITEGEERKQNFRTTNPIKLVKSYLKVKKTNSKAKKRILIKYLQHAS